MKYRGQKNYRHDSEQRIGVLLVNLGTPQAPTAKALKPYLKEFLSDPRVVETPRLLWWLILNGYILTTRPKSSAHAYDQIWTDQGSPLLVFSQAQEKLIESTYSDKYQGKVVVELGMTYGQPSIASALQNLQRQGVEAIVILPLYPQYSGATSGSVLDVVMAELKQWRRVPAFSFIDGYYDEPLYIDAIANSIKQYRDQHGSSDLLLFSYHGLPQRYLVSGDPYHCHCYKTTRLVAEKLKLNDDQYVQTFQSRFGREPWLQPYTDETLKSLPAKGIKSVQVITPGFSSDCVETLEEIDIQNREFFLKAGGEKFEFIPSLNDSPEHINLLISLIDRHLNAFMQSPRFHQTDVQRQNSQTIAKQLGAGQ